MRKKAVELPGVTLGEGMPKVCVPVMGADARALRAAADAARAQADLIELRLDSVSPEMDAACLRAACRTVREAAQGTAILATMRTARDGGAATRTRRATRRCWSCWRGSGSATRWMWS